MYLPYTNACITLLRGQNPRLIARWRAQKPTDIVMCSIVVYELRYGAARSSNPQREHGKLNVFLQPYGSVPFDDDCARICGEIRCDLERVGKRIGPHDLQIAATALHRSYRLITHNTREFDRVPALALEDWEIP